MTKTCQLTFVVRCSQLMHAHRRLPRALCLHAYYRLVWPRHARMNIVKSQNANVIFISFGTFKSAMFVKYSLHILIRLLTDENKFVWMMNRNYIFSRMCGNLLTGGVRPVHQAMDIATGTISRWSHESRRPLYHGVTKIASQRYWR